MNHLRKFNEGYDESDVFDIDDLISDFRDMEFEIEVIRVSNTFIKILGDLSGQNYNMVEISQSFSDLVTRLKRIYQGDIVDISLKFESTLVEMRVDILSKDGEFNW